MVTPPSIIYKTPHPDPAGLKWAYTGPGWITTVYLYPGSVPGTNSASNKNAKCAKTNLNSIHAILYQHWYIRVYFFPRHCLSPAENATNAVLLNTPMVVDGNHRSGINSSGNPKFAGSFWRTWSDELTVVLVNLSWGGLVQGYIDHWWMSRLWVRHVANLMEQVVSFAVLLSTRTKGG
jgi:hypothetical protein